jgi:hypothetical protein
MMRIMGMLLLATVLSCALMQEALAETRTLTTTLIVTVKPAIPQAQSAPTQTREFLSQALSQSTNQRFVRLEGSAESGMGFPRYTMMEKL